MKFNNNNNGSALVLVLGMLAVLILLATAFSVYTRVERSGTTNLRHNLTAQSGLQTALSQAINDIEKDLGDSASPSKWQYGVMSSNGDGVNYDIIQSSDSKKNSLTILNDKAQRHLNPTTKALVKNAKVDWRLIYGGISLSNYANSDKKRLEKDKIVGRIAYVAVNSTGYLDPNMVSDDGAFGLPEETHQFNDTTYAKIGNKNVKFVQNNVDEFLKLREQGSKNGNHAFTSFADLTYLNEANMYNDGKLKPAPKMFINLFAPDKKSSLFLPDVFGPSAAFGISPYPVKFKDIDDYDGAIFGDYDPLIEAIKIDGVETLTEDSLEKIYIGFHSIFERLNWIESGTYGEEKVSFKDPVTNVEWEFPRVGQMRNILTRADLAFLSFVEYYAYKESGKVAAKNKYLDMAIEIINDNGNPIYSKTYSFDGEELEGYLNAPCFKSAPMLTTVLGWTERPDLKPEKLYHHDGGGKFSEVSNDATIEPEKTTAKYYAKYELPVHLMLWAVNPYGRKAPELDGATMNASIKFGENLDGTELFKHINGDDEIKGDPKIIVDPDKTFEESVADPITLSGGGKKNSIKIEKELDDVITVYVQCPEIKKSTEENPLLISEVKKLYSWEKAGFGKNLKDYSIDVFLTVNIKAGREIVQAVPAPRIGRGKVDNLESYIHFKLPLFRDNAQGKNIHRIGYAMPIDQRFAYATECMNEFREGKLESFPYWVNNAMAEDLGEFAELKKFEEDLDDADEFTQTSNLALDPTNPYAKLAMGFGADSDSEFKGPDFWNGLMKYESTGLDFGKPYPDTLHIIPGSDTYLANTEYDKDDFEVDWGAKGIESIGELGMLCIGPWETISLYRTKTPNNEHDFHTVLDFFTIDSPSQLLPGKVNLNAPPLLVTQENSSQRVKLVVDHGGTIANPRTLTMGKGKVNVDEYVDASNGMNAEPLMSVFYGTGLDYETSWEVASRIIGKNLDYNKDSGIRYFKDISQLGYTENYNNSLLEYLMENNNAVVFSKAKINVYSDYGRESLISRVAPYVTTRGQTFTIVLRSDAFSPKFGSDVDGTTHASKVAVVEAWRDTEPARDINGNSLGYHNWHIRSFRIVE